MNFDMISALRKKVEGLDKRIDQLIMKYVMITMLLVLAVLNFNGIMKFLEQLRGVLSPIITGFALAYILNLLMVKYEKLYNHIDLNRKWQRFKRPVAICLALLTIVIALVLILNIVIPQLVDAINTFVEQIPQLQKATVDWVNQNLDNFKQIENLLKRFNYDWEGMLSNVANVVSEFGNSVLQTSFATAIGAFGNVINFILSFMLSMYVLVAKEKLGSQFKRLLAAYTKTSTYNYIIHVIEVIDDSFSNFFVGITLEAFILGLMVSVALWLFRIPNYVMFGVIVGVFALIPIFGGFLSAAIGFLMMLVMSPGQALWFVLIVIIVQQIEGNLIYPRVVGGSIGLPGLWVLIAVTVGGGVFGIPGMLVGIPLMATVYKLLREEVVRREENKRAIQVKVHNR